MFGRSGVLLVLSVLVIVIVLLDSLNGSCFGRLTVFLFVIVYRVLVVRFVLLVVLGRGGVVNQNCYNCVKIYVAAGASES